MPQNHLHLSTRRGGEGGSPARTLVKTLSIPWIYKSLCYARGLRELQLHLRVSSGGGLDWTLDWRWHKIFRGWSSEKRPLQFPIWCSLPRGDETAIAPKGVNAQGLCDHRPRAPGPWVWKILGAMSVRTPPCESALYWEL